MKNLETPRGKIGNKKLNSSRFLPYINTPLVRSKQSHLGRKKIDGVLFKVWQTYAATYLNKFSCDAKSLDSYSKKLTTLLQCYNVRGFIKDQECQSSNLKAEFSALHDDSSQATTLQINVYGSSLSHRKKGMKSNSERLYFTAIMHSKNSSTEEEMGALQSMWFPIILINGNSKMISKVLDFLMETFDSCIWELNFASHELEWMVAMWHNTNEETKKPLELLYNVTNKDIQKIRYQCDPNDVEKLWKCIHSKHNEEILLDEVKNLFDALKQHFFYLFHINLSKLNLTAIGTPAIAANKKGKLKIFSEDILCNVLQHITLLNPLTVPDDNM